MAARSDSDEESPTLMYIGVWPQPVPLTVLYPDTGDHQVRVVSAIFAQQHESAVVTVALTGACPAFRIPGACHMWDVFWYLLNSLFAIQALAFLRWYLKIEIDLLAFGIGAAWLAQRARRRGFAVSVSYADYIGAHACAPHRAERPGASERKGRCLTSIGQWNLEAEKGRVASIPKPG